MNAQTAYIRVMSLKHPFDIARDTVMESLNIKQFRTFIPASL